MTRVNSAIPVRELVDKHLLAEYREITRVSTLAQKWFEKEPNKRSTIPKKFCLGKGHVLFFIDKGGFLSKRFYSIVSELQLRGFQPNHLFYRPHPEGMNLDYCPTFEESVLLTERVALRLPKNARKTPYVQTYILTSLQEGVEIKILETSDVSKIRKFLKTSKSLTVYNKNDTTFSEGLSSDQWLQEN